jgi:4-amino-4-deoxychorismate lyase
MRDGAGFPPKTLIDGRPDAAGWLAERACQFGDGLFETIAVCDGQPCLWPAHMERLRRGCERLGLPLPDFSLLEAESRSLCEQQPRGVLKILWTGGRSARGYRRQPGAVAQRVVQLHPWPEPDPGRAWRVRLCRHRHGDNPALAGIKHLNRLDQVLARAEWEQDYDEGIMLDQSGQVVSGTMSNLFVQLDGQLLTPPLARAGIEGVVRALLIDCAEREGAAVRIAPVAIEALHAAQALYLCNSLLGVVRVDRFENHAYDPEVPLPAAVALARNLCHHPDSGRGCHA